MTNAIQGLAFTRKANTKQIATMQLSFKKTYANPMPISFSRLDICFVINYQQECCLLWLLDKFDVIRYKISVLRDNELLGD